MVLGAAVGLALLASTAGCERELDRPAADGFCPGGEDLARWVDPMIGTRGAGNAIPGGRLRLELGRQPTGWAAGDAL